MNTTWRFLAALSLLFIPVDSRGELKGQKLRCCTLVESPIVFETPPSIGEPFPFGGIAIEYLKYMQSALGFECESLKLFNATDPNNQGFTGFVYEMESCTENGKIRQNDPNCQCDIGTGGWAINSDRFGRVDYVTSFWNDDYRILTHVDNLKSNFSGAFFITAFSAGSWALIAVLLLCFIGLKLLDDRFAPVTRNYEPLSSDKSWYKRKKHFMLKSPIPYRIRRSAQSVLKGALGQPSSEITGDSKSTRQWLLNYILLLCGLFLVLSYEAVMTASLVQEELSADFRSLRDLRTCRVPASDVCVPRGGAAENLWNSAIATSACHQAKNAPKPELVKDYDTGNTMVENKTCKYFLASGSTTEYAAHDKYCGRVKTTGEPFFSGGVSFLLPLGSNLTAIFSKTTLELRAEDKPGSLDQYLQSVKSCQFNRSISLGVDRLKIFFIMAFGACALLFIIMICDPHGIRNIDVEDMDYGVENPCSDSGSSSELDSYSKVRKPNRTVTWK